MRLIGGTIVLAVALMMSGCGGTDHSKADAKAKASAAASKASAAAQEKAAAARRKAAAEKKAKATAVYKECEDVAGPLDKRLTDLDSRLSVGMQFSEYGDKVGSARAAYDELIRKAKAEGGVSDQCINKVGVPMESALRAYVAAYNTWNKCIQDVGCDIDKGPASTKMQADWSKASKLVDKADTALTELQPSP